MDNLIVMMMVVIRKTKASLVWFLFIWRGGLDNSELY